MHPNFLLQLNFTQVSDMKYRLRQFGLMGQNQFLD
jgi:hypothetical protein